MKIGIIVGSIREGRAGLGVAQWLQEQASKREGVTYDLIDLKAFGLAASESPIAPMMAKKRYDDASVQAWSDAIDPCDGYIIVTPEYNHSYPGPLKNALDVLGNEWARKAVAFVSYGYDGGVRATEHLRAVVANFQMYDIRSTLSLGRATEFAQDGAFTPNERRAGEAATLFKTLESAVTATASLRS